MGVLLLREGLYRTLCQPPYGPTTVLWSITPAAAVHIRRTRTAFRRPWRAPFGCALRFCWQAVRYHELIATLFDNEHTVRVLPNAALFRPVVDSVFAVRHRQDNC